MYSLFIGMFIIMVVFIIYFGIGHAIISLFEKYDHLYFDGDKDFERGLHVIFHPIIFTWIMSKILGNLMLKIIIGAYNYLTGKWD